MSAKTELETTARAHGWRVVTGTGITPAHSVFTRGDRVVNVDYTAAGTVVYGTLFYSQGGNPWISGNDVYAGHAEVLETVNRHDTGKRASILSWLSAPLDAPASDVRPDDVAVGIPVYPSHHGTQAYPEDAYP